MAYKCQTCGKKTSSGHQISHSNIHTKRKFRPNLRVKKIFDTQTGQFQVFKACTRCLRTLAKKMA